MIYKYLLNLGPNVQCGSDKLFLFCALHVYENIQVLRNEMHSTTTQFFSSKFISI